MQCRHGDLLIDSGTIPAAATPKESNVVAYGEATGHSHTILGGVVFAVGDDTYLRVTEDGACITHEEHGRLGLPVGDYVVTRQREYDPYEKAARMVVD